MTPAGRTDPDGRRDASLDVLRSVWDSGPESGPDQRAQLDEACGNTKSCRNMTGVTFDGFAEPGSDLGAAWREKLAREGKLVTSGHTIRDLVFGPATGSRGPSA